MNQLFAKKALKVLLDEMAGEHRLRRVLGPVTLTALGIGAVIGAGIFVATGEAAHNTAGPALMLSYCVAGVTCIFGWDLVLEYAVGAATVANGWSSYFQDVLRAMNIELPTAFRGAALKFV